MIFLNLKILLKMSIFQEIQVLDNLWKWTNELEKQKDIFFTTWWVQAVTLWLNPYKINIPKVHKHG